MVAAFSVKRTVAGSNPYLRLFFTIYHFNSTAHRIINCNAKYIHKPASSVVVGKELIYCTIVGSIHCMQLRSCCFFLLTHRWAADLALLLGSVGYYMWAAEWGWWSGLAFILTYIYFFFLSHTDNLTKKITPSISWMRAYLIGKSYFFICLRFETRFPFSYENL